MPHTRRGFLEQSVIASTVAAAFPGAWANAATAGPIKVGQIGVGHAHASKLDVFRKSKEYEVVGIVEPDEALWTEATGQPAYRGLPWMTQEQLLNTPGLQLVLVETHVRDLLKTAEACVKAGKHVHLDKPAGESLPHYRRVLDEAAKQKLLVQMGYMFRYNPGIVMLREFLAAGWLGEIFEVQAVMSKVVDPRTRKQLAEYPGGILFELGCHIIDLVVGILGKPVEVTPFPKQSLRGNDNLVDNMLAVLSYDSATATVKSTAMEVEGGSRRQLVVCGTKGTFQVQPLDDPRVIMALDQPRGKFARGLQTIELPTYTRYVDDAVDIARVLRGERAPLYDYEHDLAVQDTVLRSANLPVQ